MNKRIMMMILAGSMLFGCAGKNFPNEYPYYGIKHRHFFDISRLWESDREAGIERFLRQAFVGNMPINEMNKFSGDDDVETLSDLLETKCGKDQKSYPLCSNIVVTLGVIGGGKAGKAIRTFLNKSEVTDFRSKTDGLMALGYWINDAEENDNDPSEVITGLISCISDNSYKSVLFPGVPPGVPPGLEPCPINTDDKKLTSEERDVVRSAIIGLGLSGSTKDKRVINTLQTLLGNAPANTSFHALIMEALKAHGTIALDGLVCYYERRSRECHERLQASANTAPAITSIHAQSKTEGPRKEGRGPAKESEDPRKDDRAPIKKPEDQRKNQQAPNKKTEDPRKHLR